MQKGHQECLFFSKRVFLKCLRAYQSIFLTITCVSDIQLILVYNNISINFRAVNEITTCSVFPR